MSMKKLALVALASSALSVPAYASNAEIDQLMKEINKLKSQVNALQKKSVEAAPSAAPTTKPVIACEAQGEGFFVIPGTSSCMRFSGYVRSGGTYTELLGTDKAAGKGEVSPLSYEGRFRLNTDVRTSTDMGTLRGFARMHLDFANSATTTTTTPDMAYLYVTLGGWSVGRQDSAFLFYNRADAAFISSDDNVAPYALSYSTSVGSGVTGTLSIENAFQRSVIANNDLGAPKLPDFVGALQAVNGPMTFKLAGATHQVVDDRAASSPTKQGYAVQGGMKYSLSPETTLWFQGTYANGAMSYLGYGIGNNKVSDVNDASEVKNAASTSIAGDASVDDSFVLSSGWSVLGAVNQKLGAGNLALIGTYGDITNRGKATDSSTPVDGTLTQLEANYTFKPYAGVNFQPAIAYQRWDLEDSSTGASLAGSTDRYAVRLRAWREF